MRLILFLSVLFSLLTGCNAYQYLTISSDNRTVKTTNGFVEENDSVKVVYRFSGYNGPLQLSIFNKLEEGVRIDWSRSFMIRGITSVPLYKPTELIQAELTRGGSYHYSGTTSAQFNVTIPATSVEFLPPQTEILRACAEAVAANHVLTDDLGGRNENLKIINEAGYGYKVRRTALSKEISPVQFRVFLYFLPSEGNGPGWSIDRSFYVSEIIDMKTEPELVFPETGEGNRIMLKAAM